MKDSNRNRYLLVAVTAGCLLFVPEILCSQDQIDTFISRGNRYQKILPDSALAAYRQALDLAYPLLHSTNPAIAPEEKRAAGYQIIRAETESGHIHYTGCRYGLAMEHYEKALQTAELIGDTFEMAETIFNIGEIYLEKCDYPKALACYDSSLAIYLSMDSLYGAFWCHLSRGIIFKNTGQFDRAQEAYDQSLAIATQRNDRLGMADCYNNRGNVFKKQGRWIHAAGEYEKALKIYRELGAEMRISDCLNNLGDIYFATGQYSIALTKFRESLRLVELTDDPYRSIMRHNNIAEVLSALHRDDEALSHFNIALSRAEQINDKFQLSEGYTSLGLFFLTRGDTLQATAYLQKALKMARESGNANGEVTINNQLTLCFIHQKKYILALDHAGKALATARRSGIMHEENQALYNHYLIYQTLNNPSEALAFFTSYTRLNDSINRLEQKKKLAELEIKDMNAMLQEEITLQQQQQQQLETRLRNQTIWFLLLTILLLLLLAPATWFSIRYFRMRSASRLMNALAEVDRLKQELEARDRELAAKALLIRQKNELLSQTTHALESVQENQSHEALRQIINRIRVENNPEQWKEFEEYIDRSNPGFLKKLTEKFPDLTQGERRLCSFLRLDINTREISNLTGHSIKSIEVARTRIRKKLGLSPDENLIHFLNRL